MSTIAPVILSVIPDNSTFSETERIIATVSQVSGYSSLCVWLFAQLPQIIENHLNKSVSGVSLLFLGCWMGGDVTNLLGCVLTGALPFQTCLASYYCFIDCILALQYWYYTKVYPYQKVHHNLLQSPNMMRPVHSRNSDVIPLRTNRFKLGSPMHNTKSPIQITAQSKLAVGDDNHIQVPQNSSMTQKLFGAIFVGSFTKGADAHPVSSVALDRLKDKDHTDVVSTIAEFVSKYFMLAVHMLAHLHIHKEDIGRVLAWTCTALYVSSRTPQIVENYRKKSTKGISLYLFLFAMLGNLLYTICIVSDLYLIYYNNGYMDDWEFRDALFSQLPFIVGAAGTVTFDAFILFQCWLYSSDVKSRNNSASSNHHRQSQHRHSLDFDEDINLDYASNGKRSKSKHRASQDYFKKPDWYTNKYTSPSFDPINNANNGHINNNSMVIESRRHRPSDSSMLLSSGQMSNYSSIVGASPAPPSHYIMGSSNSASLHNMNNGGNIISNTFQNLSNSFSRSIGNTHQYRGDHTMTSTAMLNGNGNPKSPHSGASSLNNYSANSPLSTSLIPLIIGTYSSVSKKMKNEAKIPFLPIDFLHDDFVNQHQSADSSAAPLGSRQSSYTEDE